MVPVIASASVAKEKKTAKRKKSTQHSALWKRREQREDRTFHAACLNMRPDIESSAPLTPYCHARPCTNPKDAENRGRKDIHPNEFTNGPTLPKARKEQPKNGSVNKEGGSELYIPITRPSFTWR